MGRTWISTMFYKIHIYLDHPHVLCFNIISLRRSVRQPGSSFAKFIKLTDHVFLLLSKQVLQFTNFPKRK
jgi:hypothetical protein